MQVWHFLPSVSWTKGSLKKWSTSWLHCSQQTFWGSSMSLTWISPGEPSDVAALERCAIKLDGTPSVTMRFIKQLLTIGVSTRGQCCHTFPWNILHWSMKWASEVIPFPSPGGLASSPKPTLALLGLALLHFWPRVLEEMGGGGNSLLVERSDSLGTLFPRDVSNLVALCEGSSGVAALLPSLSLVDGTIARFGQPATYIARIWHIQGSWWTYRQDCQSLQYRKSLYAGR